MEPTRELGKSLLIIGVLIAILGGLVFASGKLPFRLGRLPGDIAYQGKNGGFYFPVVTCILLSVLLTLVMWLVNYFRR
jgi:Protein of unknown function (DUF2905)